MKEVEKDKEKEEEKGGGGECGGEVVMRVVDFLRDKTLSYTQKKKKEKEEGTEETDRVVRVWYYFPSLSTKEKRKDLVEYAKGYKITGWVVAGKPGVMCLEGTEKGIGGYMNDIKNISWADIPANNKKVSERFREVGDGDGGVERMWKDMQEVTESVFQGGMRGTRGNRGDMKELKGFLDQWGLGDRMEKVLGGNWE